MHLASRATRATSHPRTEAGWQTSSGRSPRGHSPCIPALTFLLSACAGTASGQAVYGSLAGTITDASGAVVPGVAVTMTSTDRNTSDTVFSNAFGFYLKERLLPGTYDVNAEIAGFRRAVFTNVLVGVDRQTRLDIRLELGALADSVNVPGRTALLKTDRADVATTFEATQLTDLPNLDRNFTEFVLLTPGAQPLGWSHAASENPQGSAQIMINGQHFGSTGYQLDGTDNRDAILGIIVINPNAEAIAEAKITAQNYDAEFGQAIAGIVSVQTRSGTNAFNGSAFEFDQAARFQSRDPFTQSEPDPETGRFLPDSYQHAFGGSIGGPIRRDRLFFFGDYSGVRSKSGGSLVLTVPTARARRGGLSEYDAHIFDPATTVVDSSGNLVFREPFPGNQIPPERLSLQAQALLSLIPLPNRPGTQNGTFENFAASGSEVFDNDTFDIRIDDRVSSRLNAFGRYSFADYRRDGPTAFGKAGGPAFGALGGRSKVRNQSLAAGIDRTIGDSMAADVRFGFFRYRVSVVPTDFGTTPARDAGIPGINFGDPATSGLPQIEVGGPPGFSFGTGLGLNACHCPLDQDERQFQIVGNLSRSFGEHLLKAGVDVRHAYNRRVTREKFLIFGSDRTRGPLGGGMGLATLLLGDVTYFYRAAGRTTDASEQQWRHFYYVQDTWHVSPRWTINLGLRLDIVNPQTVNRPGNGGFLDLETGEIKLAGVGGIGLDGDVENTLNWAPRVSIAYQPTERTVVRVGYGRSYDIGVFGSLFGHTATQNLPVLVIQQLPGNFVSFDAVFNLADGPPPPVFPDVPPNGRIPLPPGVFAHAVVKKQRMPQVDGYNATIQYLLTDAISVEAGYVGNKGTHVFAGDSPSIDANEPTLVGYPEVPPTRRQLYFARFGWNQSILYFCNCADNRYDSLQTKLEKRLSDGWSLLAHYTWQRVIQDGNAQFMHNRAVDRGRPAWNRTHNFTLAGTFELPFARGHRWLGGWQVNTEMTIASGSPFEVTYRDAGVDRDVGPNRPDLIGDPTLDNPTRDQWFNATPIGSPGSAFGRPARGTFGNLPRNALEGPGYWNVDGSLFKAFKVHGDAELELRIEAYNLLNHVNLGNPDAEIGVPGNDNPNAGRISGAASSPRNFQLALRFTF